MKEGKKDVFFYITFAPLEIALTSNETGSIKVAQKVQLSGSFEDPDVKNKSNPDIVQSWFCLKNGA